MKRLDSVMNKVSRVLAYVAALCTASIMLVIVLDLGFRTITGRSLVGAFEVVVMLVVCVVFLGLPYAERSGTAVRVTLLTDRLGIRVANAVRLVSMSFAFAATVWFTWASYGSLGSSVRGAEYMAGFVKFPTWPMRLLIAIGFTALSIVLLQSVIEKAMLLVSQTSERGGHETLVVETVDGDAAVEGVKS